MKMKSLIVLFLLCPLRLAGQELPEPTQLDHSNLPVFLDCRARCDFDYIRTEIAYVNWVRDRTVAEVHLLVTSLRTGAGGIEYTLAFMGRGDMEGIEDTLTFASSPTDTRDEVRAGLTHTIELGLVRYIARTPQAAGLDVTVATRPSAPTDGVLTQDPWNNWVFRVSGGGSTFGEELQDAFSVNASATANRTTEAFKFDLGFRASYNESNFELSDSSTVKSIRRGYVAEAVSVWSMGPHWSVGGLVTARHSTFANLDLSVRAAPAIEFDVYPYAESTRRQLTFLYAMGVEHQTYIEETIFEKTEETRPVSFLQSTLSVNQPWGSTTIGMEAFMYVDDPSLHSIVLFGHAGFRIVRGLDFNISGDIARVKDQINLPAGEATDEEILTRQRELGTDFRYSLRISLSYRFGSIYNNVVNPRMLALF